MKEMIKLVWVILVALTTYFFIDYLIVALFVWAVSMIFDFAFTWMLAFYATIIVIITKAFLSTCRK